MPFGRAGDLIWEGDLNLEGLSATYATEAFGVNLGAFWAEEHSTTTTSASSSTSSTRSSTNPRPAVSSAVRKRTFIHDLSGRGRSPQMALIILRRIVLPMTMGITARRPRPPMIPREQAG